MSRISVYQNVRNNLDLAVLPITFFLVLIAMSIVTSGRFLSASNMQSMLFQIPELGLFTLAIMISMITGGIDLSIISIANLTGVFMAVLLTNYIPLDMEITASVLPILGIIGIGLLFSVVLGLVNGFLIAYIQISPILTTLGTMILYEGITLTITKGYVISNFPTFFQKIGGTTVIGIPIPFLIFTFFALLLHVILQYRPLGKYFFMIGSNKNATEFSGINVKAVLLKTYALSALYAGIASVILISRFNSANARYGSSYLLLSALLSIMGGTDPEGGYARVMGVCIAIFTVQSLSSGFNLLGISTFITIALWGALLIVVIFYRKYAQMRQRML